AVESGDHDSRVSTSEATRAATVAAGTRGLRVLEVGDPLIVRGSVLALEDLVVRLVEAGVGVRELTPVTSPLEAAFLELTGTEADQQADQQADQEPAQ
ncbi:MAG: ABC transporter ATP-binding protein, partial [Dermatophilaceae bacterium]|nr:ABC transporter ATP-binding protein [Dermatophilaceae bacterium]